jgi:GT2 family glycosyltransferase
MRVAAVIPNWNGARLLRKLLPTMRLQGRPFDSILIVDNGSTDDSLIVCEEFAAEVVRFEVNRGFAAAVNAGVAASDADTVAVLNNDVELDPGWLERLSEHFSDDTVAFATGKSLAASNPDMVDGTYDAVSRGGTALRCGAGRPDGPFWNSSKRIQMAPFTALLIRKSVFEQVGGLDEAFESYLEDVEFGLRCASYGYTGWYEPRAICMHHGSATLGHWHPRTVRNIARNQVLLVARHYDRECLRRFGWSIAIGQLLWGMIAVRRGATIAWVAGKLEGVRLFRSYRRGDHPHIIEVLTASEGAIREVQSATGFDLYWKLYFACTSRRGTS